jgi:nucleoside-diphosphate-sugar epimerase
VNLIKIAHVDGAFAAVDSVDIVVHAATCYGRNGESASEMLHANVVLPLQILNCAVDHGAYMFCNTDTILRRHTNQYSLSKKQFLEWLHLITAGGTIRATNIVLDQFYGPGQACDSFIPWLVRQCLTNTEILLTVGSQRRRFLYIDDLVNAYMMAIQAAVATKTPFQEFQIGSVQPNSVSEVVELVHSLSGSRAKLCFGAIPPRNHELNESRMDLTSIRALGWEEHVSLDAGLSAVVDFERGLMH